MTAIAEVMLVQDAFRFDDEARNAFAEHMELRMAQPRFASTRSVRNALERPRLRAEVTRFLPAAAGDRPVP